MLPTIPEIKYHLRLDQSSCSEDVRLLELLEAATDYASMYLGRPIPWTDENDAAVDVPASVRAGILLIVADLFENRESQFVGVSAEENPTVKNLLHFYRTGLGL